VQLIRKLRKEGRPQDDGMWETCTYVAYSGATQYSLRQSAQSRRWVRDRRVGDTLNGRVAGVEPKAKPRLSLVPKLCLGTHFPETPFRPGEGETEFRRQAFPNRFGERGSNLRCARSRALLRGGPFSPPTFPGLLGQIRLPGQPPPFPWPCSPATTNHTINKTCNEPHRQNATTWPTCRRSRPP